MRNEFCLDLEPPFDIECPVYDFPNKDIYSYVRIPKQKEDLNLKQWLLSLGVDVLRINLLYSPPGWYLPPHTDSPTLTNITNINWRFGGSGSVMNWYSAGSDNKILVEQYEKVINTPEDVKSSKVMIGYPSSKHLNKIFTSEIGSPSLVNVGQIHDMQNIDEPKYVLSIVIAKKGQTKRLQWQEAEKIFKKHVV